MIKEHSPILFSTDYVGFLRADLTAVFPLTCDDPPPPTPICLCFGLKRPFFLALLLKIHTSCAESQTTYIIEDQFTFESDETACHKCMHVCIAVCLQVCVTVKINVKSEPSLDGCLWQCVGVVLLGLPTLCASLPNSVNCDIIVSGLTSAMVGRFTLWKLANATSKSGALYS